MDLATPNFLQSLPQSLIRLGAGCQELVAFQRWALPVSQ
jgi:hypothetical protein